MTPELGHFIARCLLSIAVWTIFQSILLGAGIYLVLRSLRQSKRGKE